MSLMTVHAACSGIITTCLRGCVLCSNVRAHAAHEPTFHDWTHNIIVLRGIHGNTFPRRAHTITEKCSVIRTDMDCRTIPIIVCKVPTDRGLPGGTRWGESRMYCVPVGCTDVPVAAPGTGRQPWEGVLAVCAIKPRYNVVHAHRNTDLANFLFEGEVY